MVVPLMAIVLVAGVTAIETRVAEVTVSVVEPLSMPMVAVIVVEPDATEVAAWLVASSVATVVVLEVQVASLDTSETVPSENVPVAVKGTVTATPTVGLVGESAIETRLAEVTVSCAVPVTEALEAVIVLLPAASPVATPVLAILPVVGLDEVHVAVAVTSCVVPSLNVTTAWNATVP